MDDHKKHFYEFWAQELSFKAERDLKNSIEYAREKGRLKARLDGELKVRIKIAQKLLAEGEPIERIIDLTVLTQEQIEKIISENMNKQ